MEYHSNFDFKYDNLMNNSSYYEDLNLDETLEELQKLNYKDKYQLNKLRNDNHKMYVKIKTKPLNKLPEEFNPLVGKLLKNLEKISKEQLFNESFEDVVLHNKLLKQYTKELKDIESTLSKVTKELTKINDTNQMKISIDKITCEEKDKIIEEYKKLVLKDFDIEITDIYKELFYQLEREKQIKNVYELILKYDQEYVNESIKNKLNSLNKQIDDYQNKYQGKLIYLNDLIMENSKYQNRLISLNFYINEKFDYDKLDIDEADKLLKEIKQGTIDRKISKLENLFATERENFYKEEAFIKEKIGRKNLNKCIESIKSNYIDLINEEGIRLLDSISFNKDIPLEKVERPITSLVREIWKDEITDIYDYNINKPYKFIVTNNIFKEEVMKAILISNNIIKKVNDYSNYTIGFICSYDSNILTITENDELHYNTYNDLSKLKTPIDLEREFVDFKVCNRLALDGFKTNIMGVYYIDDGDDSIYLSAVKIANNYNLPLIKIKK